jgi:hypothetical protein
MEIQLCEKKREGRDLPTFLSPPLIKFMHFNWSKLNFAFSFFFFSFFISFLICFYSFYLFIFFFIFVALLAFCSFIESLLLVNMPLDCY